jgi:mannitol-1-/sugar-/sorbitol-6-phosphatase
MTKLQCEGVLFDLDGVLVDSTPAVARVWSWWAREHGFNPDETVRIAHGRPSIATIRELLPNADHDAENREVERREIEDVEGVIPLPGAMELLRALPLERWAVVTSCTKQLAYVRLHAAGLPEPKYIVTADDITRGKPDPEPYRKGAHALSLASGDCIVVEDAPAGIRAGKAAGARVVALQTTERDALLLAASADYIVRDCSAMLFEADASRGRLFFDLRNAQAAFR